MITLTNIGCFIMIDKNMFEKAIRASNAYSAKTCDRIMNFGGMNTVLKKLDGDETIHNVAFVMYDCDESAVVSLFMSNDLAVVTNRRILIFQSRLLGTLVKEIPLKSIESISYNSGSTNALRVNVNIIGKNYSWLVLGTDEEKRNTKSVYDKLLA